MTKIIKDAIDDIKKVDADLSNGHVSIQEASQAVTDINTSWDHFAANCKANGLDLEKGAKQAWGNDTFNAFSGIKNGAATGVGSVASFFNAVDAFKGNWRDPQVACQKIETGLKQISNGVKLLGDTLQNVSKTGKAIGNALSNVSGHPLLNKMGGGIGNASTGIGTFGGHLTNLGTAIPKSGVINLAGQMTGTIVAIANNKTFTPSFAGSNSTSQGSGSGSSNNPSTSNNNKNNTNNNGGHNSGGNNANGTSNGGNTNTTNGQTTHDYTADMVNEIVVVLDDGKPTENSCCTINGVCYKLSGYSLSQELLQPMILSCILEKNDKNETQSDVVFTDVTQLIGKSFEISVSTVKAGKEPKDAQSQKAFVFKGMVIDVAASRSTASTQSASVTVATWDALLQNAPHCRSFENMSLKEIVDTVLQPYKEIISKVEPRFTEKIPYIVQYNQSDYAFLCMLAVRFGEWMYATGEHFVFGKMLDLAESVKLEYPGGSLLSYNLSQQMDMFSFNHLLPDYYQFGKEKGLLKETAKGMADGAVNTWTEKAYNASQQRFNREQLMALSSGGFDDGKSAEGADSILDYSLKIEALGKKTHLMTVQGYSKLAMLQIGQDFLIRDKVQNVSGQSEDVEQKTLKIIGVNHSFDYGQSYSNCFTAVPEACEYPSYSDANAHVSVPTQRATVVDNIDEQHLGRVRVQFPWQAIQGKEMKTPWLRIAVPYAGMEKGLQFIPEIGEEVMVGFEMNNPELPYIIGALYNGGSGKADDKWAAANSASGKENNIKAIRTRNGHTIEIHDKGDDGYIKIYDNKKENYILTFSTDEKLIKLESTGNIELYAKNDIIMHAGNNINVQAGNDRTTYIGRNDSLTVDSNQFVRVNENKDEQVANKLQVTAENIRIEATENLLEYSNVHQQKANDSMAMNSGNRIDIKSGVVKVQ